MLKIPELPIYNTKRYTNFSPITPDDIRPGDIYTNDSLFLYVSHFSFNKTAGYSVWDKEGEYVGTDMFSSGNIYAIVTYLNNNNFRPLDYDLEVVDPFNTDRRLLLTPNGIKKVNNVDEKYMRKKVSKLIEKCIRQILKENVNADFDTDDDEELSPFEEYEKDYPNDKFDVSNMTPEQLAKWCQNVGDFLYVYEGLMGLKIMAANVDNIVSDIVDDLYNCQRIEPTHEVDYLFYSREREFVYDYVLRETGLADHIKDADLVITGEGRLDGQTVFGKAPIGVARMAKQYGKPVLAFSGCVTSDASACNEAGIDAFFPILRTVTSLEDAMDPRQAGQNMTDTVEQVFRVIKNLH